MPHDWNPTMDICVKNCFSRNKIYSVQNLRTVFKPIYIVLSILGLFPYSVKLKSSKNDFTIIQKSIYLNSMSAMFIIIILCSFLALHIRQISSSFEDNSLTDGIMPQVNYVTELCTLLIFSLVTYVTFFLNRFRLVQILNMISAIIDAPYINSEKILDRLRFHINVVVMGTLCILVVMQIAVNFSRSNSPFKMFLVVFTFILPQSIQFVIIAFFYTLMMMLVEILRDISERITTPVEKKVAGFTKVPFKTLSLRQTELIYIEVFAIMRSVNSIFQAPILVTMLQCFHAIVSESHIIYHGVVVQRNLGTHDICNCSIWIVYQIIKIYAISNAGNSFTTEVLKLGRAIHSFPTERQDDRYFLEIQHLAVLMSLPGNELTVFGYFPLDATLMFKVIASAGMYIIILVQFDKKSYISTD